MKLPMKFSPRIALPTLMMTTAAAAIFSACSTGSCLDRRSSIPVGAFFSSETHHKVSLTGLEIGGVDAPADSLLVTKTKTVEEFYLPLRQNETSTQFFLRVYFDPDQPPVQELITIQYKTQPFFASEECGAMFNYTVENVETTGPLLDSVVIVEPEVTNLDKINLRFYISTGEAPAQSYANNSL